MAIWIFEPGHTEIEFSARHMMVTWVRGLFKDIHGRLDFDWEFCLESTFYGEIDATKIWTGEPTRDEHLRSSDFFDVEHHPKITFSGRLVERTGATEFRVAADVTIRGKTKPVEFDIAYLGEWATPFWVGDENRGTLRRIGFKGGLQVNRHEFGVSWQDHIPGGGRVVSDEVEVGVDVEALHEGDLERTGAIEYYRSAADRSGAPMGSYRPPTADAD
jgi:polyisoprenoid-binding protein YceI